MHNAASDSRRADRAFDCFGGRVTVIVEGTSSLGRAAPLATLLAQAHLTDAHRRLSCSAPDSELARLNADTSTVVPASRLLRRLAHAVVTAGVRSGGLVDATGVGAWASIDVDDGARTITRPTGMRIDGGGLAKGVAADLLATLLDDHPAYALDCAGAVRIGGSASRPHTLTVENPFCGPPAHRVRLTRGAAATSAGQRGAGIVRATAFAATALEAEILAETALALGPDDGRFALEHGGVLILENGAVSIVEALVPGDLILQPT